ncbi:MAG: hypothetical protein AAF674_19895 [Pseudomonadota bacterium]
MRSLSLYGPIAVVVTIWSCQVPILHEMGDRWDALILNLARTFLAAVAFLSFAAIVSARRGAAKDAAATATWTSVPARNGVSLPGKTGPPL